MTWIGFGAQFNPPYAYKYPTSIDGCLSNQSAFINATDSVYSLQHDAFSYYNTSTTLPTSTSTKSVEELIAER